MSPPQCPVTYKHPGGFSCIKNKLSQQIKLVSHTTGGLFRESTYKRSRYLLYCTVTKNAPARRRQNETRHVMKIHRFFLPFFFICIYKKETIWNKRFPVEMRFVRSQVTTRKIIKPLLAFFRKTILTYILAFCICVVFIQPKIRTIAPQHIYVYFNTESSIAR